ncbi:MAG: branched-chain alpha-keto acid dehydrogenase subunit E2, partial [Pseudomonadota bacterium]
MWRHLASNFFTFLVVAIFLLAGVLLWGQSTYSAAGPLDDAICLQVPRGSSMRAISQDLEDRGAISNGSIFRLGADYTDKTRFLKAGSWLIPEAASMSEIADIITRGGASSCGTEVVFRIGVNSATTQIRELDPATNTFVERVQFATGDTGPQLYAEVRENSDTRYRVALAEGVTTWQVVEVLKSVDALTGEVVELPPEGSLAPDSYEFSSGDNRADVLARMREAQEVILAAAWAARDP